MTSLFFRLYLAASIAVILSSVTTVWVFWSFWHPESNDYLPRLVTPALQEVAQEIKREAMKGSRARPAPLAFPSQWLTRLGIHQLEVPTEPRRKLIKRISYETGWPLAILPRSLIHLSEQDQARLKRGEVLYRSQSEQLAYVALNDHELLEAELFVNSMTLSQTLAGFHFLTARQGSLMRPFHGVEAHLSEQEEITTQALRQGDLEDLQVARLLYGPRSEVRRFGTSYLIRALSFSPHGEPQLVELGVALGLPMFPPVILVPVALLLIGVALWLSLSPLRRKLSRLAEVTERFGEGELGARVALDGRGPLESISMRFDRSADRIERLIQSHESLLQAVSHELRTPISRLYFYNDLLVDEQSREEREELGQQAHITLEELRLLTTELLDFTRLDAGEAEIQKEPCELTHLTQSALVQAQPHEKIIEIVPSLQGEGVEVTLLTFGEARLLIRAILNLLKNADHYAERRVKVSLGRGSGLAHLSSTQELPREWVWVRVDDDGPGIPVAERVRVLDPFVRLEQSRSRTRGGAGLGLSIVQSIVKIHEGHISVDESPLGGARFTLYFPAEP